MFYLLNGLKVFATAMTIFTITTNLSSIQGNLLTNTTLLENHYNDYYFGVMQIEPPFEENEEESKESEFWNDLYENEYNTINPVVCIGSRISDTDNYIFVNHNARDMLQGFSDMLTEDDEKRISWSSCQREEMRNHTKISQKRKLALLPKMQKNCVLFIKNILAESNFIISIRTEKRLLTDCQEQQIRLLFIRQMRLLL